MPASRFGCTLLKAQPAEVEHVRRHDWIVHCLTRIVCTLYWFHPLVSMAWRQLRLEAECACGEAVGRREDAAEYASSGTASGNSLSSQIVSREVGSRA